MIPGTEGSARPERRGFRRVLVGLLVFLGVLEVAWVAGGFALVRTGQVDRWINRNPETLRITYDSVWPVVPGVVRVRGFRIVNQGRGDQLVGTVDRVWGAVNLLELMARRVHVVALRAEGVTFRLRKRPATAQEAASLPAGLPSIEGVPWEPYTGPPPAPRRRKRAGTTIAFTRARLGDVREVWIGERRLQGPGTVVASVTVGGDGRIAVPHADVRFDGATYDNGAEETHSGVRLRVLGEVPPFDPKETKGVALVSLVRARVDLDARMPSGAAYLNVYLRHAPWIRFDGAEAGLAAHFSVDAGRLAPGGFVELSAHELRADFAGFRARGAARTRLDVVPSAGDAAAARLVVEFDRYGLRRVAGGSEDVLLGEGLRVEVTTPASLAALPPSEFSGRLELGRAEFPHLDFLNELLPAGGGLRLAGGSAKVEGAFDVDGSGSSCRGSMKVTAEGLSFDAGGVTMRGAVTFALAVPRGDFLRRTFDVDGTRLVLDRFAFASRHEAESAADWSASVAFPKAHLELGEAVAVNGLLEHRASDSRPIVAFLSKNEPLSGWKKRLLTVGEIEGGGRFSLSHGTLEVNDYSVGWENVEVKARFRLTEEGAFGKSHVRAGVLRAGIGLQGGERRLHLVRPWHWFEQP